MCNGLGCHRQLLRKSDRRGHATLFVPEDLLVRAAAAASYSNHVITGYAELVE